MKVGILVSSVGNFGQKGFYNSQELGLAKAMAKVCDFVKVYKLVPINLSETVENICENVELYSLPSINVGINGIVNVNMIDGELDALIHFSDTQFSVPVVYKWCVRNNIIYVPYIGVLESHSTNKVKSLITNILFRRNVSIYRKCSCFAKTPTVQKQLFNLKVSEVTVTPVGLDFEILHGEYSKASVMSLKEKYGYRESDTVILFIGRMIDEKQPLMMLDIFKEINLCNSNYKLLMIGSGPLAKEVKQKIEVNSLSESVQMIDSVPNCDIWEVYCLADAFINLNQQEIFGMAILEAMYYGCKVIAWNAPGPRFIIENDISGLLVSSSSEVINSIMNKSIESANAKSRILTFFSWESTANKMLNVLEKPNRT